MICATLYLFFFLVYYILVHILLVFLIHTCYTAIFAIDLFPTFNCVLPSLVYCYLISIECTTFFTAFFTYTLPACLSLALLCVLTSHK
jgi:hypothetical protein